MQHSKQSFFLFFRRIRFNWCRNGCSACVGSHFEINLVAKDWARPVLHLPFSEKLLIQRNKAQALVEKSIWNFFPDETRKFTFRLFIIYLHFTTPSLVFSLLFQGFKRPIASYFTRLKTLAVSKCPPAGRIEWQTSVLVNELWFVEHVKVVSFTFQVERKWLFEMSSTGYKPLNDTDTDEELKTIQGKLK